MKTRIALIILAIQILFTGCKSVEAGSDPIEVRAEQTIKIAADTFDTFLSLEHRNRALVKSKAPEVHAFAEWLREKGADGLSRDIAMIQSATTIRRAYKANRTVGNRANLHTALATLQATVTETTKQLSLLPQ
jgi:hypothetical protein